MEDLNKQQLILLVLLVSFVTSIATGIITVSLLDKAPVAVTQTVNRIVERTVETVVPDSLEEDRVVTVRETVVVTEEDRMVEAISKNKNSLVRILDEGDVVLALGVVRSGDGVVMTLNGNYSQLIDYRARFDSGDEVPLSFVRRDEEAGSAFFKLEPETEQTFSVATFGSEDLQLGQTVVAISGVERNTVSTGRVTDVQNGAGVLTNIDTTALSVGTILINLSGDVVGMLDQTDTFIPIGKFVAIDSSVGNSGTAAVGQAVQ